MIPEPSDILEESNERQATASAKKPKKVMTCKNGVCVKKPCYAQRNSTKRPSPAIKFDASSGCRPSARYCFDNGGRPGVYKVYYNGHLHVLKLRPNTGSPIWKRM